MLIMSLEAFISFLKVEFFLTISAYTLTLEVVGIILVMDVR